VNIADNLVLRAERHVERDAGRGTFLLPFVEGVRERMDDIKTKRDYRVKKTELLVTTDRIEESILLVRGHKVLVDADLAALYGVETRSLVQAVK
jgi:hypothetical protein